LKTGRLNSDEKRLFIEAACETLWVRIITTFGNVRRYASWLGKSGIETEELTFNNLQTEQINQVKKAITRCRHLIWARKCLVESIAAKRMLNRRQIPATLYMGVAKNEKGKLIAHAWLRSGNIWVTGGRNRDKFTVVGVFS
jgi:thymidylate synthase